MAHRFGWPPSVTREQTVRDLNLIVDSLVAKADGR